MTSLNRNNKDSNASTIIFIRDSIEKSPTAFHATQSLAEFFLAHGFQRLFESEFWDVLPSGGYFVVRNDSSIIAFTLTEQSITTSGFAMIGAHTDSPCLKLKPKPDLFRHGCAQLAVEVYGGALLNPWFDRDLSLAGRVSYLDAQQQVQTSLIDCRKALAVIPSLAIHLDRDANKQRSINPQKDIIPLLGQDEEMDIGSLCVAQLRRNGLKNVTRILDFELFFYDLQAPAIIGLNDEFLVGARLDNLLSCFVGAKSLVEACFNRPTLLVCSDHEEVGSASACGADGPFLQSVMERLTPHQSAYHQCLHHSLLLSVDNAHAIHPNFADRHDENHGPLINAGPVIKVNANQRYATNAHTAGYVKKIAADQAAPLQSFVVRSDMACGSTIGPITASGIGVKTVDLGVPTLAMHSIRELAGVQDIGYLKQLLVGFYQHDQAFV